MEGIFDEVISAHFDSCWRKTGAGFSAALKQLEKAIVQKNKKAATSSLIRVQGHLFVVMDAFAYIIHPVVLVIDQYIGEALEAVERKDYNRVSHELKEIGSFIEKVSAVLVDKGVGVGMQNDFKQQLGLVEAASTRKDMKATSVELKNLQKISKTFVWMATQ